MYLVLSVVVNMARQNIGLSPASVTASTDAI